MSLLGKTLADLRQLSAATRLAPYAFRLRTGTPWSAARLLRENARQRPDALALVFENERLSWAELAEGSYRLAYVLAERGVTSGDVVGLLMDNRAEYLQALLAVNLLGGITACLNTHATGRTLTHAIKIAGPRLLLVGSEHAPALRAVEADLGLPERHGVLVHVDGGHAADPAAINTALARAPSAPTPERRSRGDEVMAYLYTSGTTGLPKAAKVTNNRFLLAAHGFGHVMHEATPSDTIYSALPLYHGTAQWGALGASLATGATLALRRRFSASAFWNDIRGAHATRFMYIGELCRYLLNQPPRPDDRDHKVRIACGNGLRKDVWLPFQARFGVPLIREFYGATEGNAPMFNIEGRPGMIGRLGPGQILVACDPTTGSPLRDPKGRCTRIRQTGASGLLIGKITRTAKFDGYLDRKATHDKILRGVLRKKDEWFNSGDVLTLEEDGWVSFADRVGDTFRWKGENVSTNEVADILNGARGVLESNVYGVTVPGAEGRAGMASLNVSSDFDIEEFSRHVVRTLPTYQRPQFIRVQSDMRVTATLKHQKVDYRAEGYDPARVSDPLYFLDGERYAPLDRTTYEAIQSGQRVLR
jgi:acyl-CoA synthetase (AMP-forming)/AMP-acid ligase II